MSVRINLEIGHEASVRTKRTPEGFTHDWEVFVRGYEGAEVQYFIEKVVFNLHETFQKPKRVIKEPPYSVKESGYAGFNLPIEIYLRNKDEPKKIKFNYDLHLQPTGPPIMNVQKEKYIFNSPNEEFKNKLLRGGGIIINSLSTQEHSENHTNRVSLEFKNELTSKPKLSGVDPLRKSKNKEEARAPDSFHSVFGTPITKTTKVFPDLKTLSKDVNKNTTSSSSSSNTKVEKDKDKIREKSKYSPNKDRDKDRERNKEKLDVDRKKEKDEKRGKDRNRERDYSKEKNSKKEKSPRPRSPSPKRPPSPKRALSPSTSKNKEKEEKRLELINKDKDKRDKSSEDKSEKKPKKDKRSKEREHKENKHKEKDPQKSNEYKDYKNKEQKPLLKELPKEKEASPLPPPKIERKEKPKEVIKEEPKLLKDVEQPLALEKSEKLKSDKNEEKQKHKHKKKDKDKKDKDKEKAYREKLKDKEKSVIAKPPEPPKDIKEEKNNSLFSSPKSDEKQKKTISLFSEGEAESSNSSTSSREESFVEPIEKPESKKESIFEPKKPKLEIDKINKEKSKKSKEKKIEKEEKKRKRKSEKTEDEPLEKISKDDNTIKDSTSDSEPSSNTSKSMEVDKENQENSEDYLQILRDLQSKIMNLQDNAELQRVVQLIAETGRYELSQRTFDFDLCLLEKSTVRQLQEFFASSS